jgi:protein O-GlcNAc transferase
MEPSLAANDKKMFYRYLDNATNYFEFGSGGSTYQAALRTNLASIHSIESDYAWYTRVTTLLQDKPHVKCIYNDMDTKANTWGYPGPASTNEQKIGYSNLIRLLDVAHRLDLILIDGRFRVACCLKCCDVIGAACLIAFDDFLDRPAYHVVLEYYDIVDRTADNRMVILKKKAGAVIPKEMIKKYELVSS